MIRARSLVSMIVLSAALAAAAAGCHKNPPPQATPAPPPPPPPAATPAPPAPSPPPPPAAAPAPRPLSEEEIFARKSVDQLNSERPLDDVFFDLDKSDIRDDGRTALQKDAERIKGADQTRREASEKALRVYELLGSEKEGAGLNQAMTQAMHLDRGQMSALEARAIDDRAAGMKRQLAEAARSSGESAFRRQDWKAASQDLGRYVELEPKVNDGMIWYHLGIIQAERKKTKDAAAALKQALQIQQNFPESEDARKRLAELEKKP